jgi:hypothetical protein
MRRVRAALILGVLFELMLPAPAHAWWDWLDDLSGPGKFKGWHLEARLVCFNDRVAPPSPGNAANARTTRNAATATTEAQPTSADTATTTTTETQGDLVDHNFSGGVTLSACRARPGERRRASIDLGLRLLRYTDNSTSNAFAGGNSISLSTLVPSFEWRVFNNPRLDVVDAGVGAGVYWFSSLGSSPGGFDSFSGVIVEPVRLDFHAPTVWTRDKWWTAIPNLRFGLVVFPGGFDTNAFGANLTGDKAHRIDSEWLKNFGIFFDLDPIIRHFSRN